MNAYNKFLRTNTVYILIGILPLFLSGCSKNKTLKANKVYVTGAMKEVMWDGRLEGQIFLDTLENKSNLYGLGPEAFLTGEVLVIDGKSYTGRVKSDSEMTITRSFDVKAPFFVYSFVPKWKKEKLPAQIQSVQQLEDWISKKTTDTPFAFKLTGKIKSAGIHLQNLPKGSTVSSPAEAHCGQVNYNLENKEVTILGFFSKFHKGIFTHHDQFVHLHLITKDERHMGHLDAIEFGNNGITLFLPEGLK